MEGFFYTWLSIDQIIPIEKECTPFSLSQQKYACKRFQSPLLGPIFSFQFSVSSLWRIKWAACWKCKFKFIRNSSAIC